MDDLFIRRFVHHFGGEPTHLTRAPGRVNLIGEHTDYNDGWVLPAALPMGTVVVGRKRSDDTIHMITRQLHEEDFAKLDNLLPHNGPQWSIYVRGIASMLSTLGCPVPGSDLLIDGNLPIGSGLSSSSSLEMAIAVTLAELANFSLDLKLIARIGQRVENEVLGIQSGIMDQLTSVFGVESNALLIDCRTLDIELIPLPNEVSILILNSGVQRTLFGSALNQRRAECDSALRKLQIAQPNLRALRDVTLELIAKEGWRLDSVEARRVRHVVTENARVLSGVAVLRKGDLAEFGRQMVASHQSLRDYYEVSTPELDLLVEIAMDYNPAVFGARLTGAGFGGCVVALAETSRAKNIGKQIMLRYQNATKKIGKAYVCKPSIGVHTRKLAYLSRD
jgi:galactokinase